MNEKFKKTLATSILSIAVIRGIMECAKREEEKSKIPVHQIPPKDFPNQQKEVPIQGNIPVWGFSIAQL